MLADDELVRRRPGGVFAGVDQERSAVGHVPFAAEDGFFIQSRRRQVPENTVQVNQAVMAQLVVAGQIARVLDGRRIEFEVLGHDGESSVVSCQ